MFRLVLLVVAYAGSIGYALAAEPSWAFDSRTGCKVWNPAPEPNETVIWSGACVNGYAEGDGVTQWFKDVQIGNRVEGSRQAGRTVGKQKVFYPNDAEYFGDLQAGDGSRHGHGTLTWPNSDKYVGQFQDGKRHGQGQFFTSNGQTDQSGTWANDKFVGPDVARAPSNPARPPAATGSYEVQLPAYEQQNSDAARLLDKIFSEREGTLFVKYDPVFSDGQIVICSLDYSALMRDHAYSQGRFIRVDGSFGFSANMYGFLKIGVHDINPLTANMTPSTPSSAYFVVGSKTTKSAVVAQIKSDTPGMIFIAMTFEGMMAAIESTVNDKAIIAFSRRPGGIDIKLPLDLNVAATDDGGNRTYKPGQRLEFISCVMDLMNRASPPR